MSPRPFITDTDNGEIHAFLNGRFIRGWSYKDETEWRWKMKMAREFCEGWHQALEAIAGRAA